MIVYTSKEQSLYDNQLGLWIRFLSKVNCGGVELRHTQDKTKKGFSQ